MEKPISISSNTMHDELGKKHGVGPSASKLSPLWI